VLLHVCCGPCSSSVLEYLTQYFDLTLLWYNPNIYPEAEFELRRETLRKLICDMGLADQVTEYFSTEQMLPASGQGILAIETLNANQSLEALLARVNDAETYCIAVAEMAYLKALNAGCQFPVASFAEFVDAGTLKIRGIYWDETSQQLLRAEVQHSVSLESPDSIAQSRAAGVALAQKIREQL
jgi:hydroxymethylbilane synthase